MSDTITTPAPQETRTLEEVIRQYLRPINLLHGELTDRVGGEEAPSPMGHTLADLAMAGARAIKQWEERVSGGRAHGREAEAYRAKSAFHALALLAYTFTAEGASTCDAIEDLGAVDSLWAFSSLADIIEERWLEEEVAEEEGASGA